MHTGKAIEAGKKGAAIHQLDLCRIELSISWCILPDG